MPTHQDTTHRVTCHSSLVTRGFTFSRNIVLLPLPHLGHPGQTLSTTILRAVIPRSDVVNSSQLSQQSHVRPCTCAWDSRPPFDSVLIGFLVARASQSSNASRKSVQRWSRSIVTSNSNISINFLGNLTLRLLQLTTAHTSANARPTLLHSHAHFSKEAIQRIPRARSHLRSARLLDAIAHQKADPR
jgi:hypothetical protein